METKINIVTKNFLYKRGSSFTKLDGVIISSAPLSNISMNEIIEGLDKGQLFPKCPHYYIRNNGVVYQLLPENYKTKYCGGYADNHYIQILISEPSTIQYLTSSKGACAFGNEKTAKVELDLALQSAVELVASICKKYSFDPMISDTIISHYEAYKDKKASNYPGIDHMLEVLKVGTMSTFRDKVNNLLVNGSGFFHNGVDYSFVFDPEYYGYNNPSVKIAVNNNQGRLFEHFVRVGMKEGLRGNDNFDVYVYKNNNPDLHYGLDLQKYYEHYCTVGRREDRICI